MTYSNIPVDTIYQDIHDVDHELYYQYGIDDVQDAVPYETLRAIAFKVLGKEDYYDSDDPVADIFSDDSGMKLCYIKRDSVLWWCLQRYIGEPVVTNGRESAKWADTIRGFHLSEYENEVIYFTHGVGYDWVDSDLLGGDGDGSKRKEFEDGITIVANYEKRD